MEGKLSIFLMEHQTDALPSLFARRPPVELDFVTLEEAGKMSNMTLKLWMLTQMTK